MLLAPSMLSVHVGLSLGQPELLAMAQVIEDRLIEAM